MIGQILLTFITVLVGVNLIPSVANTVYGTTCNWNGTVCTATNTTGVNATLMGLIPLFFVLGVALTTISSTLEILNKLNV